ncbi:MAG: TSUP family transporter [Burkholderiales bacterium]|nr:TSUP family transporter [Burkholderiales bacterium]
MVLLAAAFLAGFIDSVVGGGGLIQVPALFSLFPTVAPATLLGSSKLAGIFGTAMAAWQYSRRIQIPWNAVWPATLMALVFAFFGAWTVTRIPPDFLRAALPFILFAVALYTFFKRDLGATHRPVHAGQRERALGAGAGASIGFYDGFFGPGTGSFLVFIFVRFFGFDFLRASAAAKVVNVACNFAALVWFAWAGHVAWWVGLAMAVANMTGSVAGSRLALKRGSQFVRIIFLIVVTMLILKTSYDSLLG